MIPYVYLIGWTKLDTWYCGVRYKKGCSPKDLWKTYFTSSKHVKEFRKLNGEPNHIEILKEFSNSKDAREYEKQKLIEFNVLKKDNWLNQCIGGTLFGQTGPLSEEHKIKLSNATKGRKFSEEHKKKISKGSIGKKLSIDHISKMINSKKGFKHSEETKAKMSKIQSTMKYNLGKTHTVESKLKMSISTRNSYTPRVWINNGIKNNWQKRELISQYINNGWKLGRLSLKENSLCQ